MRLFVWEALSAGVGAGGETSSSLRQEGQAMLSALLEDVASLPRCTPCTLLAGRAGKCDSGKECRFELPAGIEVCTASSAGEEEELFRQLCRSADCIWVIAPEMDHLLLHRSQQALASGGHTTGPDIPALLLCSDKYRLAQFCGRRNIPTLTTWLPCEVPVTEKTVFPLVLKPRFGAGSLGCQLIPSRREWENRQEQLTMQPLSGEWIVQPFVAGRALSTAAIFSQSAEPDIFPLGEQVLSSDGCFRYRGGRIPADIPQALQRKAEQLIRDVGRLIRGLRGYVGFDLLWPERDSGDLLLVEINPRLTTAYLGYRHLCEENLAQRVLTPTVSRPLRWRPAAVRFFPDGHLQQIRK